MAIKYGVYEQLKQHFVHFTNAELPEELAYAKLVSRHATHEEALRAADLEDVPDAQQQPSSVT